MKVHSKDIKKGLISGGIQGFIFAIMMSAFDLVSEEPFNFKQFLFYFFFFGIVMGLTTVVINNKEKNNVSRF